MVLQQTTWVGITWLEVAAEHTVFPAAQVAGLRLHVDKHPKLEDCSHDKDCRLFTKL
jgi:hypothetical protein